MPRTVRISSAAFTILLLTVSSSLFADRPAKIRDNSFLIEEAYNQEYGVIQHIQTFQYMKDGSWGYSFTQEWPVPRETNQLSYTIPADHTVGPSETGIGDAMLNYRYQLVLKEPLAIAPRFSLILPTGNSGKGLGNGAVGFQLNLPVSVDVSERWVTHVNVGTAIVPNSKESGGAKAHTYGFNAGASAVFIAAENFNLLIEVVGNSDETVNVDATKERMSAVYVNPGVRGAINFKNGLQIVPGVAMPIGFADSWKEYGVFVYLSLEHPLWKKHAD